MATPPARMTINYYCYTQTEVLAAFNAPAGEILDIDQWWVKVELTLPFRLLHCLPLKLKDQEAVKAKGIQGREFRILALRAGVEANLNLTILTLFAKAKIPLERIPDEAIVAPAPLKRTG